MLTDLHRAVGWTARNISTFGGDPNNIHLLGQSAGAHLAVQCLIEKAEEEGGVCLSEHPKFKIEKHEASMWRLSNIKQCIAISGLYEIAIEAAHLHDRGLYKHVLYVIMEGELSCFSPTRRVVHPLFQVSCELRCEVELTLLEMCTFTSTN